MKCLSMTHAVEGARKKDQWCRGMKMVAFWIRGVAMSSLRSGDEDDLAGILMPRPSVDLPNMALALYSRLS